MPYTRKFLYDLPTSKNFKERDQITQELANRVFAGEKLTLAEEEYTCAILKILRNEKGEKDIDISKYPSCKNYHFKTTYLKYFTDLNGHRPKYDYDGEISRNQKEKDVAFLKKEFDEWSSFIDNKQNGNDLINYISQETNHQIKELKKYCDRFLIGKNYFEYLKKSLVLHGKYIYLLVKEFYEELGTTQQIIEINNHKILIDPFTYVHTLFRHYASGIKEHQLDKTYHFDQNIGFKIIPETLLEILKCYQSISADILFDAKNINLKIDEKPYSIWLRPFIVYEKKIGRIEYLRVQTFYPIGNKSELDKLNNYKTLTTECGYSFYIK